MNKKWIPTVAGALEIVAAGTAAIGTVALVFSCGIMNAVPDVKADPDVPVEMISGLLLTIAAFVCLAGLISLVGGISAIQRKRWAWAVAGSIAALFVMPPAGICALVLVILGEGEFAGRSGG